MHPCSETKMCIVYASAVCVFTLNQVDVNCMA